MARFRYVLSACFMAMAALGLSASCMAALAGPRVVVTIKPIHSLAAAILEGVAEPKLMLDGAASPHSYALKPSDAKALSEADAVIYVSRNLEVFLERTLASLPANARVIELEKPPGLRLLPVREGGLHEVSDEVNDDSDRQGHEHGHGHGECGFDVHFGSTR